MVVALVIVDLFFFFKQKTAYEMRISDWSSDVCSSDLEHRARVERGGDHEEDDQAQDHVDHRDQVDLRVVLGAAAADAHARVSPATPLRRGGCGDRWRRAAAPPRAPCRPGSCRCGYGNGGGTSMPAPRRDRKSTRLNSSHYCASRMPS